jgi:hypothetical protein
MDQFSSACDNLDLTISVKKTEMMHQPAPGKPSVEPTINVKGQELAAVGTFTYLGSTLSSVVHMDDKCNARIAKARSSSSDEAQQCTEQSCCPLSCMQVKPGQPTTVTLRD